MEKVYVHVKNGLPINEDVQKAIDGFEYLGYEPILITMENLMTGTLDNMAKVYPVVGSIDFMTILFKRLNVLPDPIDYPDDIMNTMLMNREINKITLQNVMGYMDLEAFNGRDTKLFIKPVKTKLFDGILLGTSPSELHYFNGVDKNTDVWVSNKIDIVSEHRIYVHNGKVIYGCNYSGDFRINPDYSYIDKLIETYKSAPISYTIDVAILKDGTNTVVEFNDFWAIGGYGIAPWDYANMLKDRYFEIIQKIN